MNGWRSVKKAPFCSFYESFERREINFNSGDPDKQINGLKENEGMLGMGLREKDTGRKNYEWREKNG